MLKPLLQTQLRSMYASLTRASSKRKTPPVLAALLILLILYSVACGVLLFGLLFNALYPVLAESGLEWFYWAAAAAISVMLGGFITMFLAAHQLYLARDNELLLSLPIAPRDILLSRMLPLLVFSALSVLIVLGPAAFVYANYAPFTLSGIVCLVLEGLSLPLVTLALACIAGWLVALVQSHSRHRSLVTVLFSFVLIALYFVISFTARSVLGSLLKASIAAASVLRLWAFPLYWFGRGALGSVLSAAGIVLLNLGVFLLVCGWLARSFAKIVTMRRGGAKVKYEEKAVACRPVAQALFENNLRHLFGTPVWLINGGLGALMAVGFGAAMCVARGPFTEMFASLPGGIAKVLILTVMIGFCLAISLLSPAAVSLESKTRWLLQSCPISGGALLRSMAYVQMLFVVTGGVLGAVLGSIGLKLSLAEGLASALFLACYGVFTSLLGVWCGVRFPKFDWINEANAVKSGVAPMLTMLLNAVLLLVAGGIYFGLYLVWQVDFSVLYLCIWAAICAGGSWFVSRWLGRQGAALFAAL